MSEDAYGMPIPVWDHLHRTRRMAMVTATLGQSRDGNATLWRVKVHPFCRDEVTTTIVTYTSTGMVFTLADWQGPQPDEAADVPEFAWVDDRGRPAIIIDGWPVTIR